MSNSNNQFPPHLTEENVNNNQSNNSAINDDTLKFLEEASPNAAPPPAYEDVVKPEPTLPSYDYHNSYPQNNLSSQSNQSNQSYRRPSLAGNYNIRPANSNTSRGNRGCYCCCVPNRSRNKSCGCGWIIVFLVFIILTTVSIANNNACNKISLEEIPQQFSFDPINILYINVDNARIKKGLVRILQGQPEQTLVNIEVYTGSKGSTPQFDTLTQNGVNELKISQPSGFSIFNIPPRCMKTRIDVYLPDTSISNTIKVRDLNIMITDTPKYQQSITLMTEDGNMLLNYTNVQNITLYTRDGNVLLNNTSVDKININTDDGNIVGSLTLNNELKISTIDGDVELFPKIPPSVNNAAININTRDGNVRLKFGNTFSGTYDILSGDGRIQTSESISNGNHVVGNINNGGNSLNVTTDDGNVLVLFN